MFNVSNPATYLWRWQASSSLRTHREHGEFLGCAALTVWRRSEGVPFWASQPIYQDRVNQGHLPLRGDVVTWEISICGRNWPMQWNKTAQRTVRKKKGSKSVKVTHSSGSSTMQRVPKPGLSNNTSPKYLIWASMGRSLLQWIKQYTFTHCYTKIRTFITRHFSYFSQIQLDVSFWSHYAHLKKVYCLPYIQGLRVRLGYSPKGGTIRVNVSARKTKLAGSTIYQRQRHNCDLKTRKKVIKKVKKNKCNTQMKIKALVLYVFQL